MYDHVKEYEKRCQEKRSAENIKKYHVDVLREYNNKIIAVGRSNWDYKLIIYSDNSAAIYYIAKPGSGCKSGIYCGTNILKCHLRDLKRYEKTPRESLIPSEWIVKESGFFEALNII